MEGANLVLSRAPLLEPVVRLAGGGGATIVLEDLGADAPATVTPVLSSECAQAMVCVRLPAVKFKRRVQATVWAGAFVRFAAFEVAGRLLGVLGHAGATSMAAIRHF